ncbi:MAG TPA: hypothetical protein VLU96_10395, partial [Gaiellaceae bacterium]|nr:hypothetical protein [Gaiellaceae bacterium]
AQVLLTRLRDDGFVQAKIEQLGCASFRVVETGVPSAGVGKSILDEVKSAHFHAKLVSSPSS